MKKLTLKLFIAIFILIIFTLSVLWMKHMPGNSATQINVKLDKNQLEVAQRYRENLSYIAFAPHNYKYLDNLRKIETFIISQLKSLRYEVNVQTYGDNDYKNIEVILNPHGKVKNTIVIGVHYDSYLDAPGADDNASGVVILLELAKRFKDNFYSPDTRLRLVFFTNEEPPFFKQETMGSAVYARVLHERQEPVIAMYAFDALGYYSNEDWSQGYPFLLKPFFPQKGNFIGFVGNLDSRELIQQSIGAFRENGKFPSEGVSAPRMVTGIDFSDHNSFYLYNWKALMITDTAFNRNTNYHKASDTVEKLDIDKMVILTDELEKMFRKLYETKKSD